MTGPEISQIISQVGIFVGILGGLILSWRNGRKMDVVKDEVGEVKKATDGMKDELVAATAVSARSAGRDDERKRTQRLKLHPRKASAKPVKRKRN